VPTFESDHPVNGLKAAGGRQPGVTVLKRKGLPKKLDMLSFWSVPEDLSIPDFLFKFHQPSRP
jgi:hypothetical protein